jgi:hypothetical protein
LRGFVALWQQKQRRRDSLKGGFMAEPSKKRMSGPRPFDSLFRIERQAKSLHHLAFQWKSEMGDPPRRV